MTRIVKQMKMAKIYVPACYVDGGQGFRGNWTKETIFYTGAYTSETDMQEKFIKAKEEWDKKKKESWDTYYTEVKLVDWWENVEIL